jgi:hypothetical protein
MVNKRNPQGRGFAFLPMSDDLFDWQAHQHRDLTALAELAEFDHGEIDRRNNWQEPDDIEPPDYAALSDALARLVDILAGPRICKQGREASGLRVYALAWGLQRGAIGTMTITEAARACNVTPAAFSLAIREVSKASGLHFRGQRREGCRDTFKNAARKRWEKRKAQGQAAPNL